MAVYVTRQVHLRCCADWDCEPIGLFIIERADPTVASCETVERVQPLWHLGRGGCFISQRCFISVRSPLVYWTPA